MWEVEFKHVPGGDRDRRTFQTHQAAREFAEAIAISTGSLASLRRDHCSSWDIYIIPVDRLQILQFRKKCPFRDAVKFQELFDNASHKAVVVLCPEGLTVSWPVAQTA